MKDRERFLKLCVLGFKNRNITDDIRYKERFKKELKEIDAQGEHEYFLNLYDKFKDDNLEFTENQHNNITDYLLGLTNEFDIEKPSAFIQGEFPDIDIDYLKPVRDYIKRTWAPLTFGQDFICEIGTYGTSGIKSAMLDMAKVLSADKETLQQITNKMADKDDEGADLEWNKALELYPEFNSYCESNPRVANAAQMLLDRIRSGSVHAGGLIIADRRLDGFVPLEVRMVNKDNPDGVICSAWTEGLNRQDLGPVGLIKFDLLVINNLMQIALCCKLVKERHGLSQICALPGLWDFSDLSYLNDPKAIAMANEGDLKCIFQFDSEGIRKVVKRGGVSSFDDMAAYSALYRPGPLNMGMDVHYCRRKKGEEPYSIHPLMEKSLGKTYGVLVFQEQIMDILRVVGEIPDMHTEKVRKAISKKKVKDFIKYKEMFIENGQKNLNANLEFVTNLWDQIESFAEYGFNASMTKETLIPHKGGVKEIKDFVPGDVVYCIDQHGQQVETEVIKLHDHGQIEGFEVTFDDGYKITCSANHKFLTENGQVSLKEICRSRLSILCDQQDRGVYVQEETRRVEGPLRGGVAQSQKVARPQDGVRGVQGRDFEAEASKFQTCGSLWPEVFNEAGYVGSPTLLHKMQTTGMEEVFGNLCFSMRSGVPDMAREGISFKDLFTVRRNQSGKYSGENGEFESRQLASRQKEYIFGNGQKNFCPTRDSSCSCGKIKEMAGREPREIFGGDSEGMVFAKEVSHGELGEGPIGMEGGKNTLWARKKECGFCQGQHLDRSGRVLPFLRASQQFKESVSVAQSAGKGPDAQRGVREKREHHVAQAEHGVFPFFDGGYEGGNLGLGAGHATISYTGGLVHRKIVRVVPVGKCHMFDLEVANSTHNFILPNGIVTSNSHAYAYTYISARLLYLKAHYPLEFYTAILMCENDTDKFKEYKLDAKKHGIEICPVHINKSKRNFSICDNKIYFGFSNIKGIGNDVADRIVSNQPYRNISDFLERFGTDATPVKAFTSLGVFEEGHERLTLRKFAEYYKKQINSRKDRRKRFELSMEKKNEELKSLLLEEIQESDPDFEKMCDFTPEAESLWERFASVNRQVPYKYKGEERVREVSFLKLLQDVAKKRQNSMENFEDKEREDQGSDITVDQFNPALLKIDDEEVEILTDELMVDGQKSYPKAESLYYGFQWMHILETSPDYNPSATIDRFLDEAEKGMISGPIHVQIKSVKKRTSAKGTEFWSISIEDANGKVMTVNVWRDDFMRFESDFKAGNLVSMVCNPPGGGFNTLTFKGVPRQERKNLGPKESDGRLVVLRLPEKPDPKEEEVILDDLIFDENAIEFLKPDCLEEPKLLENQYEFLKMNDEPFFGD
jgi:DNA polymerase III alpha subunit